VPVTELIARESRIGVRNEETGTKFPASLRVRNQRDVEVELAIHKNDGIDVPAVERAIRLKALIQHRIFLCPARDYTTRGD
jgi:hypothetical protein